MPRQRSLCLAASASEPLPFLSSLRLSLPPTFSGMKDINNIKNVCLNRLIYRSSNSPVPNIDDIRTQGDARSENSNTSKNGCEVESEKASDIVEKRRMRSSPDLHQEGAVLRQERRCGRYRDKSEKEFG